jgi:hypothetical protein
MNLSGKKKDSLGYVIYSIDTDGVVWVDAEWGDDNSLFTDMLYDLHSGQLLSDTLSFFEEECAQNGREASYAALVAGLTKRYDRQAKQLQSTPVVRPTEVFPDNPF